ncbi:MAG: hypothetical protein K1Y02_25400 [Candidatus Hydrogenedentes bacterium]|nr:hypothetical protein [Candidatus Hydrogenedentota bacterium]
MKTIVNIFRLIFYLMVAVIAVWIGSEVNYARRINPKGKFGTLQEYLARHPDTTRIYKTEKNGNQYIIAHGKVDAPLALPSSPPAYVFDSSGKLIDWAKDPGDNSNFQDKWRSDKREAITRKEIEKTFQPAGRADGSPAAGEPSAHP